MGAEWSASRLDAQCERVSVGHVGPTSQFFCGPDDGVPLLRSQNVRPGRLDLTDVRYVTRNFHAQSRKSQLRAGDILFVRVGENRGDCCIVPEGAGELNCANVVFARPRKELSRFLGYYFQSPSGQQALRSVSTGSAQGVLNTRSIASLEVPLPPAVEASAIAYILGTLDDKIELNRRMNETLEAMARALFKSWFVDFDPVRAKAEGRDPGLHVADLFPDRLEESELGEIPAEWKVRTVADCADLNPESWTRETRPSFIDYVDLSNTKWGRIEAVTRYAQKEAPSRAQRVLRAGDTIVGTVRPGNGSYAFIAQGGLTGSTGFAVLRPLNATYAEYVFLAATSRENIDVLSHLADGGAYPAVRPEVVAGTQVIRPSDQVLSAFSRTTSAFFGKMDHGERESRTLAVLRDAILPKLISGELRLRDAERIVAEAP